MLFRSDPCESRDISSQSLPLHRRACTASTKRTAPTKEKARRSGVCEAKEKPKIEPSIIQSSTPFAVIAGRSNFITLRGSCLSNIVSIAAKASRFQSTLALPPRSDVGKTNAPAPSSELALSFSLAGARSNGTSDELELEAIDKLGSNTTHRLMLLPESATV